MGGKRRESGLRALRRGAALGLALTALWIFGLTADLSGAWDALGRLGQTPSFVLGALSQELEGAPAGDGLSPDLDRWGRLLRAQSALRSGGRPAVDAFLAEQAQAEEPPAEPIDQEEPELSPVQHGEVVEYTNLGKDDGSYLTTDQIYVKNSTQGQEVDVAALASQPVDLKLGAGPQILIVHTHGSEAYTMPKGQEYAPTGTCRTADNSVNMIRVGDEIAAVLSSYGISVLHDRVLYDDPAYDGAYERAADAICGYLEKYPTLSFVLDVHRDAIEDKAGHQYKVITREDPSCAQISFVMGSNNDHWLENVKLAVAVQQRLTDTSPTLMRPMTLRNSNYNQHLTTGSMLVEIGTAGNSLSEALRAAQLFAMGFAQVVTEK